MGTFPNFNSHPRRYKDYKKRKQTKQDGPKALDRSPEMLACDSFSTFGREHYEVYFCENISYLDQRFRMRCGLKLFLF